MGSVIDNNATYGPQMRGFVGLRPAFGTGGD